MSCLRHDVQRVRAGCASGGCASTTLTALLPLLSQVTDWEVDGRTELDQLVRIFAKEKTSGDKRVLPVLRRGDRGVAFCDALNKLPAYPAVSEPAGRRKVFACSSRYMRGAYVLPTAWQSYTLLLQ